MPKRPTNTKKDFERLHKYYQKIFYRNLRKEFRKIFKSIPFDNLTYENAMPVISLNVNDENLSKALMKSYKLVGLRYGKHVNRDIEKIGKKSGVPDIEIKAPYPLFSDKFIQWVEDYFKSPQGVLKFQGLTETMTKTIRQKISDAQAAGLTQKEMIREIKKEVNKSNFYRWQAMRIARTESAISMNTAKQISFENSAVKMQKEWILGGSANHRIGHVQMDGTRIGTDEYFNMPNGDRLKYPGDPNGQAKSIVNCSCSFGYVPIRDSNGRLVFKD